LRRGVAVESEREEGALRGVCGLLASERALEDATTGGNVNGDEDGRTGGHLCEDAGGKQLVWEKTNLWRVTSVGREDTEPLNCLGQGDH